MNFEKEFKCPFCYMRTSAIFGDRKSLRITCLNCGREFTAEVQDGRVRAKAPLKENQVTT